MPDRRRDHHADAAAAAQGLPGRRLHADAAARSGRRRHALAHLLLVPDPLRRHRRLTDQPPGAGGLEVPPRPDLPGLRVRRRRRRRRVPARRRVGARAAVRPAAVPHPHQDASPSTPSSSACSSFSASPASSPRVCRIAFEGRPDFEKWCFVGYPLSWLFRNGDHLHGWHQAWWASHVVLFFIFLAILPVTMIRHMFTSPLNMYLRDRERPKGAMKAMPNLMETELETFGASTVEDFTWKQLLDTDACTMCGRCTSVCPAHATGKPLDPREIVLEDRRGHGRDRARRGVAADRGRTGDHRQRRLAVRAHHTRGGLGLHVVQGVRRDLPGEHRDPRQDPRHAALPVADGVELPDRARHRVPLDGELREPVGHEPGRPRRLDEQGRRCRRSSTDRRPSITSTSTGSGAPAASTTRTRRSRSRWPSCCSGPASTSRSSDPRRTAPATLPGGRATSTSSRCSPCRTSRRSTAWA